MINRRHLRAARALLDWSMADLAQASGLSFSTIRRLEESSEGGTVRSRRAAVAALRAAGIDFSRAAGDAVAIAKVGRGGIARALLGRPEEARGTGAPVSQHGDIAPVSAPARGRPP